MYTQLAFALDRIKALAPQHPAWKDKQPFKAVLDSQSLMDKAEKKGWIVISMKNDWARVFAFDK